eukprot:TRINITY_DN21855_c0_g2_i2.p2 TRINITY_DN21855_c0_g2~~TRINITY_DN21855_c0_g2_i2.p2  ORF type:complete len:357 (+),score=-50.25 TRINITY_DN21855_c0_g2_i2:21-1091(+)
MLEQQKHKITTASHSQENNHFEQLKRLYEELRILKSNLPKRGGSYTGYWTTDFREQVYEQEKALTDWKKAAEQDKKWIDRYNISRERAEALYKAIDAFQEALLEQAGSPRPGYCNKALSESFFTLFDVVGRCIGFPFLSKTHTDFLHRQLSPNIKGRLAEPKRLITQVEKFSFEVLQEDSEDNLPISYALFHAHPLSVVEAYLSYYADWQLTHRNRSQKGILDHAVYYGNIEAAQLIISKMPEGQLPFCSPLLHKILTERDRYLEEMKKNKLPVHEKHLDIAFPLLYQLKSFYKKTKKDQKQDYKIGLSKHTPSNFIENLFGFFSNISGAAKGTHKYQELPDSETYDENIQHKKGQ